MEIPQLVFLESAPKPHVQKTHGTGGRTRGALLHWSQDSQCYKNSGEAMKPVDVVCF